MGLNKCDEKSNQDGMQRWQIQPLKVGAWSKSALNYDFCVLTIDFFFHQGGQDLKNGHLTVQFPPSFERMYDRREDSWTWLRHPVNLSCIAESIPNATITWLLNGQEIRDRNIRKFGSGPESTIEVIYQGSRGTVDN